MRLPYHADIPRWLALYAVEGHWEYAAYVGNNEATIAAHLAAGVVRPRAADEPTLWYAVASTSDWAHVIHWDRTHDLMWVDTEHIVALFRTDSPWVEAEYRRGERRDAHYKRNARWRIRDWHAHQDPYRHAEEVLRKEREGFRRAAHLLEEHGLAFVDLWRLGLVRNRPQGSSGRASTGSGIKLQVHPIARPHLVVWERWQDVLIRPRQEERFKHLLRNVLEGRTVPGTWP